MEHCNLAFTHDFASDFDLLTAGLRPDYTGGPYAFVRLADGERAILCRREHVARQDHWRATSVPRAQRQRLRESLTCELPGWHVGISSPCQERTDHRWLLSRCRLPAERVTFASVFIFANWRRFKEILFDRICIVSTLGPDYEIPQRAVNDPEWSPVPLATALHSERRPILIAGGPAANQVILEYWKTAPHPQVILDVGSALDPITRGRRTRSYHFRRHPAHKIICRWT